MIFKVMKKKKSIESGAPTEDLKFSVGDKQIENHEKFIKHPANETNNKFGAPLAHTSWNENDHVFIKPTLSMLEMMNSGETSELKATKNTKNEQKWNAKWTWKKTKRKKPLVTTKREALWIFERKLHSNDD